MLNKWDKASRVGLDTASTATSVGFAAAKQGTKLGFAITKVIASSVASLAGSAVDHAIFGGSLGAGPVLGGAISTAISGIEALTLVPILLGESIASTTLVAAHSSLSILQAVFPGSDEASFSLTSFATLVRREWKEDMNDGTSPENKFGVAETMKALVAWATLQGVTNQWQEQRWFKHLVEIHVNDETADNSSSTANTSSRLRVTSDATRPHSILLADIGEASSPGMSRRPSNKGDPDVELKARLRRLSKLVLAGYGGASLLFFGVPPIPPNIPIPNNAGAVGEERELAFAINSSEAEVSGHPSRMTDGERKELESKPGGAVYSWWNVLLGKHDKDIVLQYAQMHSAQEQGSTPPPAISPMIGTGNTALMPRFWVLTDHSRREVVLVIRGTMSLNELAVDLTCDPAEFSVHHSSRGRRTRKGKEKETEDTQEELDAFDEELEFMPGCFPMDLSTPAPPVLKTEARTVREPSDDNDEVHLVHGGMLKMARVMGDRGKPVHTAIRHALRQNADYNLVICGHSLGAGVAALLAMMWADPETCLTHRPSGLPTNRRVQAYCFAPPCLVSAPLSALTKASGLVTSFVYSHDVVSRLSLGAVRDLRRAASWLCEAESEARGEGYGGVTGRMLRGKVKNTTGWGAPEDAQWFLAVRKTLEANMHNAELFPPGRVLWAIRDGDLHPAHRLRATAGGKGQEKVRLFDVQKVDEVFDQIVFARDMLSSHMPHQYDRVLHELL